MIAIMRTGRPRLRPKTDFGKTLAALREQKGVSQGELAEAMGVTQSAVAHWERRSVALTPEQIKRIAEVLGVSFDSLFGAEPIAAKKTPSGKMWQLFEAASQLPKRQQHKIADVIEPFIEKQRATS
jgi:transcriptional regulator with XRE-family HTH domain